MLKVTIASDNIYYRKGLEAIITHVGKSIGENLVEVIPEESIFTSSQVDIVCRDIMISIFRGKTSRDKQSEKLHVENSRAVLHIPFVCRGDNLAQITGKIKKIITIASTRQNRFDCRENYKSNGLKDFMQLSSTESKVLFLIGQGYDKENISRILGRSEKTVNTHCRNAIRKLGMINRVDFYRYAAFVARCGNKKWNTLCL